MNSDGTRRYEPHDVYSMRQAIEEGFILDVLKNYIPYKSYYRIVKTAVEEKYFDKHNANNILRRYADNESLAIKEKSAIMMEHFYNVVHRKIKGRARAMVVTSGIKSAIEYYFAITDVLKKRQSRFKAVIAFSGECEYKGAVCSESSLNGFPSSKIEEKFRGEPYRILIVADKFQTGYDEPLLQTMYVDKKLTDIKAVQTLSRLNRCAPNKLDVCILDFVNEPYDIKEAFERYYKSTMLFGETAPNQLNEFADRMHRTKVYSIEDISNIVEVYLNDGDRNKLDSILNKCVDKYNVLDVEDQINFRRNARNFVRTYNFLSAIMPVSSSFWEKLSIFLTLLVTKLPLPMNYNEDSIIENVNLENYRAVAQETLAIVLENENAVIKPDSVSTDVDTIVEEQDTRTHILMEFHKLFGDSKWSSREEADTHLKQILMFVQKDGKVQNAIKNSDEQNAESEIDRSIGDAIDSLIETGREIYLAYNTGKKNNLGQSFKSWLNGKIFQVIYVPPQ